MIIMWCFSWLLWALTLLPLTLECQNCSRVDLDPTDSPVRTQHVHHSEDEDDEECRYDSAVLRADRVVRPLKTLNYIYGPLSHSGVRVTLQDGSKCLIHKVKDEDGLPSRMVVTKAEYMSSMWRTEETKEFNGRRTVADFVEAGGQTFSLLRDNCHHATDAMMNQ